MTTSKRTTSLKRSRPALTFTQGLAALRLAKAQPWGDNIVWMPSDHRNENRYLNAYRSMEYARITGRADIMAAIDFITEEEVGEEMLEGVLSKIRWHHEEAGMSPEARVAYQKQRAAARARLKEAA
jgi:hypothetical protein